MPLRTEPIYPRRRFARQRELAQDRRRGGRRRDPRRDPRRRQGRGDRRRDRRGRRDGGRHGGRPQRRDAPGRHDRHVTLSAPVTIQVEKGSAIQRSPGWLGVAISCRLRWLTGIDLGDMDPEAFRRAGASRRRLDRRLLRRTPDDIPCSRGFSPATSQPRFPLTRPRRASRSTDLRRLRADRRCPASPTGTIRASSPTSRSAAARPACSPSSSSAALNVQAMLWRTSPAATELEEVTLGWLRRLLGLPTRSKA